MNEELTNKLISDFPIVYKESDSLLCFGFECNDGWEPILREGSEKIEKILKDENDTEFRVLQVKEKFGGLRFYINSTNKKIIKIIKSMEEKCSKTCEICGKKGEFFKKNNWIVTLCKNCWEKKI